MVGLAVNVKPEGAPSAKAAISADEFSHSQRGTPSFATVVFLPFFVYMFTYKVSQPCLKDEHCSGS